MKKIITNIFALSLLMVMVGCSSNESTSRPKKSSNAESESSQESSQASSSQSSSSSEDEDLDDGREVRQNQLYTDAGLKVEFSTTGASISKISWNNTQIAKDGFVVGRCANRIANGHFEIDGTGYDVSKNDNNKHSLHGGSGSGFNSWRGPFATKTWEKDGEQTASSITFKYVSADGENGYPGEMTMRVKYTLKQSGELSIEYTATTTAATLCNPTNHLYMNLNGTSNYDDLNLMIDADSYTPLDSDKLPTGTVATVENTIYDYRTEQAFRKNEEYDDNYVLNGTGYRKVASMTGTSLNIKVDVFTDRPGLQLYKAGSGSVCLESQMMPDAINHDNFADPILRPGEEFKSKTTYAFTKLA